MGDRRVDTARPRRDASGAVLVGGSGMLGGAVARLLREGGHPFRAPSREELDLSRPETLRAAVESSRTDLVINAAAFTDVNRAELSECRDEVFRVNRDGPAELARVCASCGARFVHVSTDYVFDGSKGEPYTEDDPTAPAQVYGRSKLEGERAVSAACPGALIVRTSTLYGPGRRGRPHYVDAIREQAIRGGRLEVVELPVGSPTLSSDLASGMLELIDVGARGIVHVVNRGACSRLQLARAVIELCGRSGDVELGVRPPGKGGPRRPAASALDTSRFASLTGRHLRPWREALAEYLTRTANEHGVRHRAE